MDIFLGIFYKFKTRHTHSGRRVVARLWPKRHAILSVLFSSFYIPRLLPQEVVISQSRIYARVGQNVSGIVWKINHDRVKNILYHNILCVYINRHYMYWLLGGLRSGSHILLRYWYHVSGWSRKRSTKRRSRIYWQRSKSTPSLGCPQSIKILWSNLSALTLRCT